MSIHASDPFATPEEARSPVRRLRGRLPAAVTLWTARDKEGRPAGLTVSSAVIVDGDPGWVLGILDAESTLWEAVRETHRFALAPLSDGDQRLADAFAGVMPAPGGPFAGHAWRETEYGPVLESATAWAGCRLTEVRAVGFGLLIEAAIDLVEIGAEASPLIYHRGRYLGGRRADEQS